MDHNWKHLKSIVQRARSVCSCAGLGNDWANGMKDTDKVDVPLWLMRELWDAVQNYETDNPVCRDGQDIITNAMNRHKLREGEQC